MSLHEAFAFLEHARVDAGVQRELRSLGAASGNDLVRVAAAAGFACTQDELTAAYRYEWALRLARYAPRSSSLSNTA